MPENTNIVEEGLLTVEEASKFLRLSPSKIYKMMYDGSITFCRLGRARRIPLRALHDFASAGIINARAARD